jgi:hypothetical protein
MAAGGFREFLAGETLDEDAINDYLMQGVLVFAGTAARGSAITSPVEGQFSFLKDSDTVEFYDGSAWVAFSSGPPEFDFLVIGGGGAGGGANPVDEAGGGGGAGGYRTSTATSGGSASAEASIFLEAGSSYTVTVGAGAAGVNGATLPNIASSSVFANIISVGGGFGGNGNESDDLEILAGVGGSGGGGGTSHLVALRPGAHAITRMGSNGGNGLGNTLAAGGGGGAGAVGGNATTVSNATGGAGGAGLANSITGSSVTRGGGGGGGAFRLGVAGAGGAGGGGAGALEANGNPGTANTGGGGGGSGSTGSNQTGGNGGSGIVIIKYPDSISLTIGGGLTSSTTTSGGFKVTSFTAGTDVISF